MSQLIELERITAFIDGELDLSDQLEMERRYEAEPALRRQVDEARELRATVKEARYHAAPDALRQRLAAQMGAARVPAPAKRKAARPLAQMLGEWFAWRPMVGAVSMAAAAMFFVNMSTSQSIADRQLEDDVVASHVRSTLGQHLVDVSSSDHHQVKPFLSARLGFSPPVGELQVTGSEFLGGRVDYLDGRPVAALVYKQGPHVVNSFIWPTKASDSKPVFSQEKGFRTAHWAYRGMAHWAISDVNAAEFQTVVQAIQRGDDQF
jgi:anti-sigma factor RsiW